RDIGISDNHHGFKKAQVSIRPPILRKLDRRTGELPRILLEFGFQPLKKSEGVGRGAGESADHVALAEPADLLGVGFDNGLADRDLAVATNDNATGLANGEDGSAVPGGKFVR